MKRSSGYNEAVKHFNRVGGQLKRHYNINPEDYLLSVPKTEKGVKRALDKMRLDVDLESAAAAVEEYERSFEDAYEEAAKEADFQDHVDQYEQARETLKENYDIDMDDTESEIFWRAFDDPDILDAFGSTNVLYMGEEVRDDDTVTMKQAAEIAKGTAAKSVGSNRTSEEIRSDYNNNFNAYKEARATGLSHKDAINKIFK